jgi:hypothetical protein
MAVAANVLIFERIKEELGLNSNIQEAISSGYDKALLTIADANITRMHICMEKIMLKYLCKENNHAFFCQSFKVNAISL